MKGKAVLLGFPQQGKGVQPLAVSLYSASLCLHEIQFCAITARTVITWAESQQHQMNVIEEEKKEFTCDFIKLQGQEPIEIIVFVEYGSNGSFDEGQYSRSL